MVRGVTLSDDSFEGRGSGGDFYAGYQQGYVAIHERREGRYPCYAYLCVAAEEPAPEKSLDQVVLAHEVPWKNPLKGHRVCVVPTYMNLLAISLSPPLGFWADLKKNTPLHRHTAYSKSPRHPQRECAETRGRFSCRGIMRSLPPNVIEVGTFGFQK